MDLSMLVLAFLGLFRVLCVVFLGLSQLSDLVLVRAFNGLVWTSLGSSGLFWTCLGLCGLVLSFLGLSGLLWACLACLG